jgi:hypothetical protein
MQKELTGSAPQAPALLHMRQDDMTMASQKCKLVRKISQMRSPSLPPRTAVRHLPSTPRSGRPSGFARQSLAPDLCQFILLAALRRLLAPACLLQSRSTLREAIQDATLRTVATQGGLSCGASAERSDNNYQDVFQPYFADQGEWVHGMFSLRKRHPHSASLSTWSSVAEQLFWLLQRLSKPLWKLAFF